MSVGVERRDDVLAQRTAQRFRVTLGEERVSTGESVWRYACAGVVPQCVVTPGSVEEVAETVKLAFTDGLALVPSGNATHLHIGSPPRRYDAALSIRRLGGTIAHDAADMTVSVPAGVTLQELNAELGRAGQWLPLDPAHADAVTVGGLVAADRNGPMRLAYGKVRDLLLGVRVVTADGGLLKGGGRVVKNVAGYDLPKLFVASYGTLGVIVEASFRLWPRPAEQRLFVSPVDAVDAAVERGLRVLDAGVAPLLLEALNPNAGEAVGVGSGALLIGCVGGAREIEASQAKLEGLLPDLQSVEAGEAEALRKALAAFPQPISEDALVARVSVLPADLARLLRWFEAEAERRGVTLEVAAHAGSGVAWCQLAGSLSPLDLELCAEWMRVQARRLGGWLVLEAVPEGLLGRVDPWGFNEATLLLMRRVKTALDPKGVFAPGRFVGGI